MPETSTIVIPAAYLLCALIGFVAGVLNALAGGGSFLTLPLLLFLGLPASVANGTNRVGVLAQNISAVWGFHRYKVLDWKWAFAVSAPGLAGAALGSWGALQIPDSAFRRLLAIVMLVMTLGTLLRRGTKADTTLPPVAAFHWTMVVGFFFVGIYAGVIQAGIGFLILAITSLARIDLVRGNAIKVLTVMLFTALTLAVFAGTGNVDWPLGLALGVGNFVGGEVGVRIAVLRGHRWLERFVTAMIVIFAILLWVTG